MNFQLIIKRVFDITISLMGLVIFIIPVFLIMILMKLKSKGPIFFKQERPGKNGKIFNIYKLRTLQETYDKNGHLLPDKDRMTRIGRFLRRFSLDELPELWNILKGDMSFVGPRPLLVAYLKRYTPEQARRHEMKPGITGWAQINGRNAITWEEKFRYDVWYVDHWNFWLDTKIICITLFKVIKGEGVSQFGHATIEEFKGSDPNGKQ